jgi:hypothetical protein
MNEKEAIFAQGVEANGEADNQNRALVNTLLVFGGGEAPRYPVFGVGLQPAPG